MPVSNRSGGLHKGTLFDTNIPATTIDKDIFTDQEVEDTIAGDDLVLMLDVSEDPDKIKYMTRTNFVSGLSGGTITVTDNESTNEENLITFVADAGSSTGLHGIEMDGNLAYNPSTGTVSATNFSGTSSLATSITATANNSADETVYPTFVDGATGTQGIETDTGLTYNPSSGILTATQFTGAVSGNASTATALATGRTIGMTGDVVWTSASFDGSGNVTGSATIQANSVALGTDTTGNYVQSIADAGSSTITVSNGTAEGGAVTLTVAAAQTTITSILATDLKIGEDDQTKIDFETPNQINFYADNANQIILQDGVLVPANDNEIDLGTSSTEFKDAYFDGTVTSDAFAGPLTGNASTATALETARTIGGVSFDGTGNINLPGVNTAGNQNTSGTAAVATTVTITDNESTDEANAIVFTAGGDLDGGNLGLESDGTLNYNPSSGTLTTTTFAGALTGNVTGNASGTAATVTGGTQASITNVANVVEVGALNAGSITSGFGTINTGSSTITTSGVITAGGITIGSAAILEAELEIIDGATVTTTELNLLDGDTSVGGSITLADGDGFIVNDGGTMKTIPASDISEYVTAEGSMSNWVLEDDDGTEVTITNTKEIKLIGSGITTNWTDTDNGTDADPYDMTFTVDAAQTGITSIYATDLILGEDSETAIDFGTANEIDFKADNAARLTLTSSALYPVTNNQIDLGTSSLEFKDAFFDGTVTADAFAGPLTGAVTGNADTATLATTVTITDNESTNENNAIIFTAGGDLDGGNLGLESDGDLHYNPSTGLLTATSFAGALTGNVTGTASTATVATTVTITDNESTDEDNAITFTAGGDVDGGNLGLESDGTLTYNPSTGKVTATGFVGTLTGDVTGNVTGNTSGTAATVTSAAQTNITSLGTLTALTVDDVAINGKVMTMTGSTDDTAVFTVGTNGTLSIVTTDTAAAAANLQITADGTVDIDSAGVLTLDSGAAINIEPASGSAILLDGTISIDAGVVTGATSITSTAFVGDITGDVTGNADTATVATTVTITDNESTDEDNAVIFTAGGDVDGGNLGLESDGHLTYNPSTGRLTATQLAGTLQTAAQTNVTSVGTLGTGAISSGFGNIDVGSSNLTATGTISLGATSFNDNGITNVGDIALDSISADATDINIAVSDNSATALTIKQGSDAYLIIDTANTSESVSIGTGISGTAITIGHGTSETTFGDNVTITGDLTINGATVTNSTTNLTVADPLVKYGQAYVGSAYDQGFIVTRGNGSASNTQNMGFIWDESADEFATIKAATEDGTTAGNVTVTDYVNLHVGAITADDTSVFSGSIELGHATDTTIARSGSGDITIEGNAVYRAGGTDVAVADGGTGASSAGDARTNLGLGTAAVAATGISNTNVPVFTTGVADDDFLRVAGTSIEGRSASEVASDIGAATVGLSVAMAIAL